MDIEDVIYRRRTIRRFIQKPVSLDILKKLVDLARVAPMARNVQAIEFIIVQEKGFVQQLFPFVKWASSLPENERKPEAGREPTAYIIVMTNRNIKFNYVDFDVGAAVENILLGAVKYGLGSCWMGSIDVLKIRRLFLIPDNYDIKQVISLGYPDETSVVEPFKDSFNYWKENGVMHVPKRSLDDIIFKIF